MKELLCGEIDWKDRIRDLSPIDMEGYFCSSPGCMMWISWFSVS